MKCAICDFETKHNELLLKHITSSHPLQKRDYASFIRLNRIYEVCNEKRGILQWSTLHCCSFCFDIVTAHAERRVAQEIDRL